MDVLDLAKVEGVEESHGVDCAEGDILLCYYFVHLLKFWGFEVEADLFSDQVWGLFWFLGVWVGPSVGKWKLQSVVGVLQFQRKFQGVFELVPSFSIQNGEHSSQVNWILFGSSQYFLVDERERTKNIFGHRYISSSIW